MKKSTTKGACVKVIVLNGVEPVQVDVSDFKMRSAASDKIVLPFTGSIWGDLAYEIESIILSRIPVLTESSFPMSYDDVVKDVGVKLSFNVQRSQIRITAYIDAITIDNQSVGGKVFLDSAPNEIKTILDAFFAGKDRGLSKSYDAYYQKVYDEWKRKNIFVI